MTSWTHEDVDRRERVIATGLAAWSAASVLFGIVVRGAVGRQHVAWGAVDGAIAARGLLSANDRRRAPCERGRRLRRLLLANAALDVGYVGLGVAMSRGRLGLARRPDGAAVVVQGGFLLGFDLWHASRLGAAPGSAR